MPKMVRVPAFAEMLRVIAIGESLSRSRRVALADAVTIGDELARLRNTVNQATSKARQNGSNFKTESGSFIADDLSAMLVTVVITRMPDSASADDEEMDI